MRNNKPFHSQHCIVVNETTNAKCLYADERNVHQRKDKNLPHMKFYKRSIGNPVQDNTIIVNMFLIKTADNIMMTNFWNPILSRIF